MSQFWRNTPHENSNIILQSGFLNNMNNNYSNNNYHNVSFDDSTQKERQEISSIIGIGDCMFDIIAEVDEKFIQKFELDSNMTKLLDLNNRNIFEELERMSYVYYTPGGSVQNILRVISQCLHDISFQNNDFYKSNYSMNINQKKTMTMVGCVGNDIYKDKIMNSLIQSGVIPLLNTSKSLTSKCGAAIYKKNSYLISEINASKDLDKEFILKNEEKILKNEILLIEGYYIKEHFEIIKYLCDLFIKDENKIIALMLSPVGLNYEEYEKIMHIANFADIILGNVFMAGEIAEMGQLCGDIDKIFVKIFQKLNNKNRLIVLKNGKDAAYCAKYNYVENHLEFILTYFPYKIRNEEIIDELGIEDAFFGGFLSEFMKGSSLYSCLKKGCYISNISLKNFGCTLERKK